MKDPAPVIVAEPVRSLYWARRNDAPDTKYLMATCGTNISYWTGTAWSHLKTDAPTGARYTFDVFKGYLFLTSLETPIYRWDFTAATLTGPMTPVPENYRFIRLWNDRLWVGSGSTNRSRLRANRLMGTALETFGMVWDVPGDAAGREITGMEVMRGRMYVFALQGIWALTGYGPFSWRRVQAEEEIGCDAPYSIVKFPAGFFIFHGPGGLYFFPGDSARKISRIIQSIMDDVHPRYVSTSRAVRYGDEYWYTYCSRAKGGVVNNRTIVLDTGASPWSFRGPYEFGFDSLTRREDIAGEIIYAGSVAATGQVYQLDSGLSDDDAAIPIDLQTGIIILRDDQRRELVDLRIVAEPAATSVTVSYALDNATTWIDLGTVSLTAAGEHEGYLDPSAHPDRTLISTPLKFPSGTNGRRIQLRLRESSTVGVKIHGIEIVHQDAEFRRY